MPQLDIYTYFTQFQWFLVIFTLIFILINGKFVPTFQSLFIIRQFIGTLFDTNTTTTSNKQTLRSFDYEKNSATVAKSIPANVTLVSRWDEIYEKYHTEATKTKKKPSNKVNKTQKPKTKKKISKKK